MAAYNEMASKASAESEISEISWHSENHHHESNIIENAGENK